jgi:hypothetical protein
MRIRARLQRLEKTCPIDRVCPACRHRREDVVRAIIQQNDDGTTTEPEGLPAPCAHCGESPEKVLAIVEVVVESPSAVVE